MWASTKIDESVDKLDKKQVIHAAISKNYWMDFNSICWQMMIESWRRSFFLKTFGSPEIFWVLLLLVLLRGLLQRYVDTGAVV